jgi:retinol dehydrogenase 12
VLAPLAPPAKVALVTGGTSGIGRAVAIGLADRGFHVVLLGRDEARVQATIKLIRDKLPKANLSYVVGDLALQSSVRSAATTFLLQYKRLDVLVNCAGVFLPEREVTAEGIEATFATNHLGHFLLTNLLLPLLKSTGGARVVSVASRYGGTKIDFDDLMVEERKYSYMKAVPASKLAQVLFTQQLAERLQGSDVLTFAVHPGLVANTKLLEQTGGFFRWMTNRMGGTPEEGADTVVWLATAPKADVAALHGRLVSKRKAIKTPGQGSDPKARQRLWAESERLAPLTPITVTR